MKKSSPQLQNIFFNAHHAPAGAFASFTLGAKGKSGGLGLELGGPANQNVFVGVEESDGSGIYRTLPFYEGADDSAKDYDVEGLSTISVADCLKPFDDAEIHRDFTVCTDTWRAGDLTFRIYSPIPNLPDPSDSASGQALMAATCPGVLVELTIDNTRSEVDRKAFFGFSGSEAAYGMRPIDSDGLVGIANGLSVGIAALASPDLTTGLGWQAETILTNSIPENNQFMLGSIGMIVANVPAGKVSTTWFAVGFFRDGTATAGLSTRYLYRRYFNSLEAVLSDTLRRQTVLVAECSSTTPQGLEELSPNRNFMLSHAIRSYYGATQLLESADGEPIWVVNEGEYRMLNTLDLTIDQAFFELAKNPWTVKNVLNLFAERYSYTDALQIPGSDETAPGGISFTHDMGIANAFSAQGKSGYELAGLTGCFSYMTAEELMNWILTAGLYVGHTQDLAWLEAQTNLLVDCLLSLENRDHPEPEKRNGVVSFDSDRCMGGAEITTYDSLDASLGQARNNLYLAVKGWACYLTLEFLLNKSKQAAALSGEIERCRSQAERALHSVSESADEYGLLPSLLGENNAARLIPAIEGLIYPFQLGIHNDQTERMARTLKRHFVSMMSSGYGRFADHGWKLSSTSNNSWLSKIYLCQFIAESILGVEADAEADAAHTGWLLDPRNAYFAWSDQMLSGVAVGSKYYPRGVTAILWLSNLDTSSGNSKSTPYAASQTKP